MSVNRGGGGGPKGERTAEQRLRAQEKRKRAKERNRAKMKELEELRLAKMMSLGLNPANPTEVLTDPLPRESEMEVSAGVEGATEPAAARAKNAC